MFIGSTEADTLSSSNRREHGNFSHVIRQAFHHEEAQVDRKTESTLRIKHPRLALVLSGTPQQFPRFMEGGVEDGLYSRFGVYSFESPVVFEPQWATPKDLQLEAFTERAGQLVLKLYKLLRKREKPLYFDVPAHLRERLTRSFKALHDALAANSAYDLIPTVRRGVVITLRIAAVLAVWRYFEEEKPLGSTQNILATEADVEAAVALGLVYVEHALREALRMEPEIGRLPDTEVVGGSYRMTGPQRRYFDALPQTFRTGEAESLAENLDVPRSTMFDWLSRWVEATLLEKLRQGLYEKRWRRVTMKPPLDFWTLWTFPQKRPINPILRWTFHRTLPALCRTMKRQRPFQARKFNLKSNPKSALTVPKDAESPRIQRSPIPLYVGQLVETSRGPGTVVDIPGERQKVKVRVDALADTPMPVRAFDAADLFPLASAPCDETY